MQVEFMFIEWLTLYSWPLWGYSRIIIRHLRFLVINPSFSTLSRYGRIVNLSTTSSVESLTYLWSINCVSWKLCEFTFFEWLTLYSWPIRGTVESSTSPRPVPWSRWRRLPVKFQLCILKTGRMHVQFTFFEWLTLYSQASWGYRRIYNPFTTCSWKSLTCMRSLNFISWKLCECTSN